MASNDAAGSLSRRKFLQYVAAGVGGVGLPSLLTACGGAPAANGGSGASADAIAAAPTTAAGEQSTITYWYWEEAAVRPAIDEFEEQNPTIKVDFQQTAYADTHTKLLTSLAAGSGAPDVCSVGIDYVGAFSARGGLVDLAGAPFDGNQYKDAMVEYKWIQGSTEDGRVIAMPWDIGPSGLWYREDLLKAAGLESDQAKLQEQIKSWDDWFQLGQDLRSATPDTALVSDVFADILLAMVEQQGHGWFDGNKLLIEEKAGHTFAALRGGTRAWCGCRH